jgi:competence protein ComEC
MHVLWGLGSRLGQSLAGERDRWILWAPVAVLAGIVVYFSLPFEPWAWAGACWLAVGAAAAAVFRSDLARVLAIGLALVGLGLAAAQLGMWLAAAPVLEGEIGPRMVTGTIVSVETRATGTRIVLSDVEIARLAPDETPARVRITIGTHGETPEPGGRASVLAMLRPPSPPTWPGGFDFARQAYFAGIGAVGYAVGPVRHDEDAGSGTSDWGTWVGTLRQAATGRILRALDPPTGAVAAALLTGQRSAVPEATLETIRQAGLAHLLAISGLHLGLVAAVLFVGFRTVAAAFEPLALRFPIKSWAAAFALFGTFCYLWLSGATVPTQRAFIMTAIVLVALIIQRDPFSMRLVAVAALAVMLIAPVSVLGPSFQMSFAAVVALIAGYEAIRERWPAWRAGRTHDRRLVVYVVGLSITTVIANLATAAFVLAHFNRWAVYGLAANLAAVPITAFWVMPWGLLALMLMPFGLEVVALVPMGWGIDVILAVADWTATRSGSVLRVASPPQWLPVLFGFGLIWLCLWRTRLRLWGVLPMAAAVIVWAGTEGPDILVSDDAGLVAVRDLSGDLVLTSYRRETFTGNSWLAMAGQNAKPTWPEPGEATADGSLRCDSQACIYRPGGADGPAVSIVTDPSVLAEDCARSDFVVSLAPAAEPCRTPLGVIDRFDLWRSGAYAVWISRDGIRMETVAEAQGDRPWAHWPDERGADQ